MWTNAVTSVCSLLAPTYDDQFYLDEKAKVLKAKCRNKDEIIGKVDQPGFLKIPINERLSMEDQHKFRDLLKKHSTLFDISVNEVSVFKNGDHPPLKLPLSSSVYSRPNRYDIPSALVPEFGKQLQSWIEGGVVVPQKKNVQYRNNIACAKKSDGSWRFCLDASVLNCIIESENQIIPKISQLLHDVSGHKYYTTLDLSQFFLNFKLDEQSSDLTTFFSPIDNLLYKFIRSPFGIRWSMSYAIRLCNEELSKIPNGFKFFRAYVDDILVFSSSIEEHYNHLDIVLERLRICNFKVKPKKMKVAFPSADIFGYLIDETGFTISPSRKEKLMKLKRPSSKKELQQIIGKLGYFRMIMGKQYPMGAIQAGFSDLVSAKSRFLWKEKHEETWKLIKKALFNTVRLTKLFESDEKVILRSDSSDKYFGATLSTMRENQEVLIHCMSRMWTSRFVNAHITQKELMAVLLAIADFKFDLIGRQVEIQLDNAYAAYVLRNPGKTFVNQRCAMAGLLMNLQEINYSVTKTSNKDLKFKLCDLLSRQNGPKVLIQTSTVKELLTILPPHDPDEIHQSYIATQMVLNNEISSKNQIHHSTLKDISGMSNLSALNNLMQLIPKINNFMNKHNLLEVPTQIRSHLVTLIHTICHFGNTRIVAILNHHNYKWRGMHKDVSKITRQCQTCQRYKASNKRLQLTTTSNRTITSGVELAADLKEIKGNQPVNILVVIDVATHYIEAARVPGCLNSQNIAKTLLILLARIAPTCQRIKFDNDPKFKSIAFQNFLKTLGITPIFSARLSSQSNSLIERSIGLLSNQISYLDMSNLPTTSWDVGIALSTLFVNLNPRASMGYLTPYELMFGKSIILDEEHSNQIQEPTIQQLSKKLHKRIESLQFLKRTMPKEEYPRLSTSLHKIGDMVRIRIPKPPFLARTLAPKWSSAIYEIIEVKPLHFTYKVRNVDNKDDIRICHDRGVKKVLDQTEDDVDADDYNNLSRVYDLGNCTKVINDIENFIETKPDKNHEKTSQIATKRIVDDNSDKENTQSNETNSKDRKSKTYTKDNHQTTQKKIENDKKKNDEQSSNIKALNYNLRSRHKEKTENHEHNTENIINKQRNKKHRMTKKRRNQSNPQRIYNLRSLTR